MGKGEGGDGGLLCSKGVERGGEEAKGRYRKRKGREGMWGRFAARGCRGGEEGKGRSNGELTLTPEP